MPQISQLAATYASQIFWLLLTFGFVFFVVGLGMVPKVQGTIDSRDKSVADDLAAAEAARAQADAAEENWRRQENAAREQAQTVLAKAREAAAAATAKSLSAASEQLNAKVAEDEVRIAASTRTALAEIETVAADAAQDIVVRLANVTATAEEARSAVKTVIANG